MWALPADADVSPTRSSADDGEDAEPAVLSMSGPARGWADIGCPGRGRVVATLAARLARGMEVRVGPVVVHYVEHGTGRPVLVLHGAPACAAAAAPDP